MSKVNELFEQKLNVVNFGIESFYQDLVKQDKPAVHVDWKPIAGGDKKIAGYLRKLKQPELYEKIQAANQEALSRILSAQPVLVGMSTAGEAIPGMTPTTILHAGPPVTWENMCGPVRGAVMGGLIYEGLAKDLKEAEELAASGKITFSPCHHHNAVGPMAGIVTYSMPVWHVVNKTFGIDAYCTMNEGLGKVLRFGACDQEVFDRLHRMREVYYPVLKEALELHGEIDLKVMIAQALQMGDEGHNRNKAGTSLLLREIAQDIYNTHFPKEQQMAAFKFLNDNDHVFLNHMLSDKHNITFVSVCYSQLDKLMRSGEIDASFWSFDDRKDFSGFNIVPFGDLESNDMVKAAQEAVLLVRSDSEKRMILSTTLDQNKISEVQRRVVGKEMLPSY